MWICLGVECKAWFNLKEEEREAAAAAAEAAVKLRHVAKASTVKVEL